MQAINKYIIIEGINEEVTSDSGLMLTGKDANAFRYLKGKVINPGTNVDCIKVGDIIHYDKGSGHTMIIDNKKYIIIKEGDVVVVL